MNLDNFYKKQIIYAGFYSRILASMVDICLFIFLFAPVKKILDEMLFRGEANPYNRFQKLFQQIFLEKRSDSLKQLAYNADLTELKNLLFAENFLYKILFIYFFQIVAISIILLMFWLKKQSTPGKLLLRLRILSADGQTLTLKQGLVRILGYLFNFLTLGISCFSILFTDKKQLLQDLTAKTIVIKV